MEEIKVTTQNDLDLPWLTFTLCGNAYAINSKFIDGIMTPPEEITPIPDSPRKYIGMLNIRGDVFPLLDMRVQFKNPTMSEEISAFEKQVDEFIERHKKTFDELKNTVSDSTTAISAVDDTKCGYSLWAEKVMKHKDKVGEAIAKAQEPHKALHHIADRITEIVRNSQAERREEELKKVLAEGESQLVLFTDILKEAEYTFKRRFRETIINLSDGDRKLGIMVDEVLGVGEIEMVKDSQNLNSVYSSNMFEGVGLSDKTEKEILIINEELLIKQSDIE
ncbi:MAG: chemotaxis protein CheW [Ruminococcus sp.]|jgi:purine-binding chemotaxis protein CheW|nr:chemotaxis protein CheW [Ruminococcus sp.]